MTFFIFCFRRIIKVVIPTPKTNKQTKQLEIELPYDPAIPLLGIHTEETRRERDWCTPMFIAALFKKKKKERKPHEQYENKQCSFHNAVLII